MRITLSLGRRIAAVSAFMLMCLLLPCFSLVQAAEQPAGYAVLIVGNEADTEMMQNEKELISQMTKLLTERNSKTKQYVYPKARSIQVFSYHVNHEREKLFCEKKLNILKEDLLFVGIISLQERLPQRVLYRVDRIVNERRAAENVLNQVETLLAGAPAAAVAEKKAETKPAATKPQTTVKPETKPEVKAPEKTVEAAKPAEKKAEVKTEQSDKKVKIAPSTPAPSTPAPAEATVKTKSTTSIKVLPVREKSQPVTTTETVVTKTTTVTKTETVVPTTTKKTGPALETSETKPQSAVKPAAAVAAKGAHLSCQVGAFSNRENAAELVNTLQSKGYAARLVQAERAGGVAFFRVYSGTFYSRADAENALERLKEAGYPKAILVNLDK